jgi:hypothetical protein
MQQLVWKSIIFRPTHFIQKENTLRSWASTVKIGSTTKAEHSTFLFPPCVRNKKIIISRETGQRFYGIWIIHKNKGELTSILISKLTSGLLTGLKSSRAHPSIIWYGSVLRATTPTRGHSFTIHSPVLVGHPWLLVKFSLHDSNMSLEANHSIPTFV